MLSDPEKEYTAGIIGGAGYTAGELIRLLLNHPNFTLQYVQSHSHSGQPFANVHADLVGETDLIFTDQVDTGIDVLFLAKGHGEAAKMLDTLSIPAKTRIIDLSQDFRFAPSNKHRFVYGLPEANRIDILKARYIANPGCFATAILLGLLPLAATDLLKDAIHVNAMTGSTGAGQGQTDTTHFSWRYSNISVYKAFEHQHLHEISAQLGESSGAAPPPIYFIPMRGNFTRGILASMYTRIERSIEEVDSVYRRFYQDVPFVFVTDDNPDIKMVINTNKCVLHLEKHHDMLFIISVIDNLIKGAAGQAVQNMNLMFGLSETAGLQLKSSVY